MGTFMTVTEGHQRLRETLGLKSDEPKFVHGDLQGRTPVRIVLNGESRVADAIATGARDRKGNYIIKYVSPNGRKHRLVLSRWHVMLP